MMSTSPNQQTKSFQFGYEHGSVALDEILEAEPELLTKVPIEEVARRAVYDAMIDEKAGGIDLEVATSGILQAIKERALAKQRLENDLDAIKSVLGNKTLAQHLSGLFRRKDQIVTEDLLSKLNHPRYGRGISSNLSELHEALRQTLEPEHQLQAIIEGVGARDQELKLLGLFQDWQAEVTRVQQMLGKDDD